MSNYETFDNNLNKQAMQEDLELKMKLNTTFIDSDLEDRESPVKAAQPTFREMVESMDANYLLCKASCEQPRSEDEISRLKLESASSLKRLNEISDAFEAYKREEKKESRKKDEKIFNMMEEQAAKLDQLLDIQTRCQEREQKLKASKEALKSLKAQMGELQVNEHVLKQKVENLLDAGKACKKLEWQLKESQAVVKTLKARLLYNKSNLKNLKKKSAQLKAADEKVMRLKKEQKEARKLVKAMGAQMLEMRVREEAMNGKLGQLRGFDGTQKKLETDLVRAQASLMSLREKMAEKKSDLNVRMEPRFPRISFKVLAISLSISVLTSLYFFRKAL